MQPDLQTVTSTPPRVFNYSLDWRFLLPIADLNKGYILFEEDIEFSQTLEYVGIHDSQRLSFSDLRNRKSDTIQFFVIPFGLPAGEVGTPYTDRVEFYSSIRRVLETGGYLLVGFNNNLHWRATSGTKYHSSTPRRITRELKQAGFKSVEIFGAISNLQIPEYIFELEPQTIRFVLQNRFKRKPVVLRAIRVLAGTIGWNRLSHFLPCYFAVAIA